MTDTLAIADLKIWMMAYAKRVTEREKELTDLDRQSGDGDFGLNASNALHDAAARLNADECSDDPFLVVSQSFVRMGGTSGPLFGAWFEELSASQRSGVWTVASLATGAIGGLERIQHLGGARVGDKTMVDAMAPVTVALSGAAAQRTSVSTALHGAALAARFGAMATAGQPGRRGRAFYVGEAARGVVDPGALAIAYLFEASESIEEPG